MPHVLQSRAPKLPITDPPSLCFYSAAANTTVETKSPTEAIHLQKETALESFRVQRRSRRSARIYHDIPRRELI
jgi:hypothetical protein